jgi:hypothetical protein
LFLRHAHEKMRGQGGASGSKTGKRDRTQQGTPQRGTGWTHTTPPPVDQRWWQSAVVGSLKDLAKAMGVSQPIIRSRDETGTLWVLPVHTKKYQVWFQTKNEYDQVQKKMPKERKST